MGNWVITHINGLVMMEIIDPNSSCTFTNECRDHEITRFWEGQTKQTYGNFEGGPINSALFGVAI